MDAESLHFNARMHYYKNNDDVWSGILSFIDWK